MSEGKINLEEILLQNHFHILDTLKNVYSPDTYTENMYERLINGINDICKQLLELAAENAKINWVENNVEMESDTDFSFRDNDGNWCKININEQSILNTIKQVE